MKQENIVRPPPKPCIICDTLTDKPYGRTTYGDNLCSKKCNNEWHEMDLHQRFTFHERRRQ